MRKREAGASTSSARTAARRDRSPRWRERERRGSRRMANGCCIGRECQFGARCTGAQHMPAGRCRSSLPRAASRARWRPVSRARASASGRRTIHTSCFSVRKRPATRRGRSTGTARRATAVTVIRTGALDALQKSGVTGAPGARRLGCDRQLGHPGEYRERRIESLEDQTRRGGRPHRSAARAIDVWHRDRTKPGARRRRSCGVRQPRGKRRRVASDGSIRLRAGPQGRWNASPTMPGAIV